MTTATYEPMNTTASTVDLADSDTSPWPVPDAEQFILIPGGWLPREQEYYWSEGWQTGERETLAEIQAGEGVEFDNAEDLIRWLFKTD